MIAPIEHIDAEYTVQAYIWPDGSWELVDEVEDLETYASAHGLTGEVEVRSFDIPRNGDTRLTIAEELGG